MDTKAFLLTRERIQQRLENRRSNLSDQAHKSFNLFGIPVAPVAGFLWKSGLQSIPFRWLGGLAVAGVLRVAVKRLRAAGWERLASLL